MKKTPTKTRPPKAEPSDNSPVPWKHWTSLLEIVRVLQTSLMARLAGISLELVKERASRKRLEIRVALLEKYSLKQPETVAGLLDRIGDEMRETHTDGYDNLSVGQMWDQLTPSAKLAHLERIGLSPMDLVGGVN